MIMLPSLKQASKLYCLVYGKAKTAHEDIEKFYYNLKKTCNSYIKIYIYLENVNQFKRRCGIAKPFPMTRTLASIVASTNDPIYQFVGVVYQTQWQITEN